MLIFVALGRVPLILVVALAGLLYLTWVDLRRVEQRPLVKFWWFQLVLLFNVLGYAALRVWLAVRARADRA